MGSENIRNKVLVLGRSNEAKINLIRDLYKLSSQSIPEELLQENNEAISIPFKIDNKYYSADIDFWIDLSGEKPDIDTISSFEAVGHVIDAILFIFTLDKVEYFQDITLWSSFIKITEPVIAICVNFPTLTSIKVSNTSDPEDWCIDNGFEYIDLTSESQEIDGISRVFEALQSHTWEGLSLKTETTAASQKEFIDPEILPDHLDIFPNQSEISAMHDSIFGSSSNSLDDPISRVQILRGSKWLF